MNESFLKCTGEDILGQEQVQSVATINDGDHNRL